jgi:hypothetical protein
METQHLAWTSQIKTFPTNLGVFAPSRLCDKNKQPLKTSQTLKGSMQDSLTQIMTTLKCTTHDASAPLYPFSRKGAKTAKSYLNHIHHPIHHPTTPNLNKPQSH